ncbi:CoA transferase [Donghicola sp. C2-DW-16]|uniref:CoA transferase n=1 Tax=Donghicola mangrovi TaxID=2729614 RepID=A0ABX2PCV4_9RHOB|nr:CaiB/BaiF CoA-transferase family protein [Donghicola mangrovi]NVO27308.1 CoA transferase [Donghicola mangrovi]
MSDLQNLLVVSLEHAVAAPYASCKLADAGARVIKVERPEGDFARNYDHLVHGESAYFVWINRGKESICLNLKTESDRAVLRRMIGEADVFLQNLGPGVIERLGIDIAEIRKRNPKLVFCSISGYGSEGPAKDQKAYDLLIQAETGLSAINGLPEGPARVGVSVCDIAAGMTAFSAILQALLGREKTGLGRDIEVSLFHSMADWMNVPYLQYKYGHLAPTRMGLNHPTIAPYGAFPCSDGKEILISIQNEREWRNFCRVVFRDEALPTVEGWRSNSERIANRAEVDAKVAKVMLEMTRDEAIEKAKEAGIAYGRLSDMDDVISHPQHRYVGVRVGNNEIEVLAPGAVMKGQPWVVPAIPEIGQDSDRLRGEFSTQTADAD